MAKIEHLLKDAENAYYSHDSHQFRHVMSLMAKQMLPMPVDGREIKQVILPEGFMLDNDELAKGIMKIIPCKVDT